MQSWAYIVLESLLGWLGTQCVVSSPAGFYSTLIFHTLCIITFKYLKYIIFNFIPGHFNQAWGRWYSSGFTQLCRPAWLIYDPRCKQLQLLEQINISSSCNISVAYEGLPQVNQTQWWIYTHYWILVILSHSKKMLLIVVSLNSKVYWFTPTPIWSKHVLDPA